jgi:transposase-like protein
LKQKQIFGNMAIRRGKMARQEAMTLLQFQKKFSDEQVCREHLFEIRWPGGFICPRCGHTEYYNHTSRHLYQCKAFGYQASVTAGTVMHKTRIALVKWFWAIFLASHDKRGISAVRLEQELGISYPSAWLMLHKIRKAMGDRDGAYQLAGLVEMDETCIGGPKSGGETGPGDGKVQSAGGGIIEYREEPGVCKDGGDC